MPKSYKKLFEIQGNLIFYSDIHQRKLTADKINSKANFLRLIYFTAITVYFKL